MYICIPYLNKWLSISQWCAFNLTNPTELEALIRWTREIEKYDTRNSNYKISENRKLFCHLHTHLSFKMSHSLLLFLFHQFRSIVRIRLVGKRWMVRHCCRSLSFCACCVLHVCRLHNLIHPEIGSIWFCIVRILSHPVCIWVNGHYELGSPKHVDPLIFSLSCFAHRK